MNERKKKKSGAENAKLRNIQLLKTAGESPNQKTLLDCFKATSHLENNNSTKNLEENDLLTSDVSSTTLTEEYENRHSNCLEKETIVEEASEEFMPSEELRSSEESRPHSVVSVSFTSSIDLENVAPFKIPKKDQASIFEFMKLHPIQPSKMDISNFFTRDDGGHSIPRRWLSYDIINNMIYCSTCMAFSDGNNIFRTGVVFNKKHSSTRIKEHEKSDMHFASTNAYIRYDRNKTIDELLNNEQRMLRLSNVRKNQEVVKRIVEWILCMGRQGIAYRGSAESTKYFKDASVNHGNLLEILFTASQHDEFLKQHIDNCATASGESATSESEKGTKGRGSKLTFLSKSTFNKLIQIIGVMMKQIIVNDAIDAGMYALMVDSTQDIVGHEQCSIVVRYVNRTTSTIHEKLIGLLRLEDTSGEGYFDSIVTYLDNVGLGTTKRVACSFDGASNMRSDEKGLQGRLKETDEDMIYTWCYSHNLSLGMTESTTCTTSAINLFGLLQSTRTFCSESYKRVLAWEKLTGNLEGHQKLLRLESLGKTRWYSKETSLTKIFGSYSKPKVEVFLVLLNFLHHIKTSKAFDSKTSYEASALLENWLKMDVILTAFVFLKIFESLGHLSAYLQTKGIDMMAALTMAKLATSKISKLRDSFEEVKSKAIEFVQVDLPTRRIRRKKRLPGELMEDEPIEDIWLDYKINQFLIICDTTANVLESRFTGQNEVLMQEMSFFHPRQFKNIEDMSLEFPFVSKVLKIDNSKLVVELKQFASIFFSLKSIEDSRSSIDEELDDEFEPVSDKDDDDDHKLQKCVSSKKSCHNCLKCCFEILGKYNLHLAAYSNLYRAYEYFMTLPCTQVTCECTFSKLKVIKNRLRSALGQNLLEALLLMYVERELTYQLDINEIVRTFAMSSSELKRNLIE